LLYLLLYTQADDEGRMCEEPARFAFELFPGERAVGLKIEAHLLELQREELIGRYDVNRVHFLVILDWAQQKVDHPRHSKFPPPPSTGPLFVDELAAARAKARVRHLGTSQNDSVDNPGDKLSTDRE
jgi:hypothetical protein